MSKSCRTLNANVEIMSKSCRTLNTNVEIMSKTCQNKYITMLVHSLSADTRLSTPTMSNTRLPSSNLPRAISKRCTRHQLITVASSPPRRTPSAFQPADSNLLAIVNKPAMQHSVKTVAGPRHDAGYYGVPRLEHKLYATAHTRRQPPKTTSL